MPCQSPKPAKPRILIVTPEITYLPPGMGNMTQRMSAKAGGLADVSASLVSALFELGRGRACGDAELPADVPGRCLQPHDKELRKYHEVLPDTHIHLAEDRIFYYREQVYSTTPEESMRIALVFQREVINHIIPRVRPDLIHCNDWMTALIPAMARRRGIKSLFTVHNIHTRQVSLAQIEECGHRCRGVLDEPLFLRPARQLLSRPLARAGGSADLRDFRRPLHQHREPALPLGNRRGLARGGAGFGARRAAQQIRRRLLRRHPQRAGRFLQSGHR